jgi:hypothetical protein
MEFIVVNSAFYRTVHWNQSKIRYFWSQRKSLNLDTTYTTIHYDYIFVRDRVCFYGLNNRCLSWCGESGHNLGSLLAGGLVDLIWCLIPRSVLLVQIRPNLFVEFIRKAFIGFTPSLEFARKIERAVIELLAPFDHFSAEQELEPVMVENVGQLHVPNVSSNRWIRFANCFKSFNKVFPHLILHNWVAISAFAVSSVAVVSKFTVLFEHIWIVVFSNMSYWTAF